MNEKNYKILILFGGVSSEHDISCISAASVMKNIDIEKYDITAIGITKDGKWMLTEALNCWRGSENSSLFSRCTIC